MSHLSCVEFVSETCSVEQHRPTRILLMKLIRTTGIHYFLFHEIHIISKCSTSSYMSYWNLHIISGTKFCIIGQLGENWQLCNISSNHITILLNFRTWFGTVTLNLYNSKSNLPDNFLCILPQIIFYQDLCCSRVGKNSSLYIHFMQFVEIVHKSKPRTLTTRQTALTPLCS